MDISELIKSLEQIKDKVYYDAIENSFSHELMTPLNPIAHSISMLKRKMLEIYAKNSDMIQGG